MAVTHKIGISSFAYCFACGSRPFTQPKQLMTPHDIIDKAVALGVSVVQFGDNMPLEFFNNEEYMDEVLKHMAPHCACLHMKDYVIKRCNGGGGLKITGAIPVTSNRCQHRRRDHTVWNGREKVII